MGVIAFALSVHHFISTVGSDAGFASIIGLAILVLLYFAQARETASLREHAHEATEHVQQLEARVAQLSQLARAQPGVAPAPGPVVARPAPRSAPAASAGAGPIVASRNPAPASVHAAVAGIPSAPAGVAAPALTAATRLIPIAAPVALGPQAATPSEAGVAREPAGVAPGQPAGAVAVAGPPPATAAGGANGAAQHRVPPPAAGGSLPPQPPPRASIRSGGPGAAGRPAGALPRRPPPRGSRSGAGRAVLIALGLLGVAAVVAVLLIVTGGTTPKPVATSARTTNAPKTHHKARPATFKPSSVTVAVLNGTATNGLAGRVSARLQAAGYKKGAVATAPDQTHTATIVAYLPGDRRDALAVAGALKLGSASVQAVDPTNQAVACPPSTACTANVVVIVGADLASTT